MTNHFLSSRSFARAAILAFVCLFSAATEAITSSVGATPGSFAVSPSGAANYTIPLAVSPGTAGMEPKLALTYNSQGGNGLLGMGWSLSGLSAIHRCAATIAQDGFKGGINYNKYDRYCLDGKRLVRTDGYSEPKPGAGSGLYTNTGIILGTYLTEYSLETDPSIRIVATAYDSQRIPAHFSVYTKSGQIMEFGVTPDSRIEAQGKSSVAVWALNKLQDTVGNYFTVTYLEDNANGQYHPTRIDYTGNASKGLTPYNSVQFIYEPQVRPDIVPMYQAGSLMRNTALLKNVQSYAGASLVKDYRLVYDPSGATQRSRVASVQECALDGADWACLPRTSLTWQESPMNILPATGGQLNASNFGTEQAYTKQAADLNGDGIADLIAMYTGPTGFWAYSAMGRGDGTFASATGGQLHTADFGAVQTYSTQTADLNGDGITDLVAMYTGPSGFWAYSAMGRGDGTFAPATGGQLNTADFSSEQAYTKQAVDLNGDGITDLVAMYTGPSGFWAYSAIGRGDGTFASATGGQLHTADFGAVHAYTKQVSDLDGDGKGDLVAMYTGASGFWAYSAMGRGDGTFAPATGGQLHTSDFGADVQAYTKQVGDFNGDGKGDLVAMYTGPSGFWAYSAMGRGDGTFAPATGGQLHTSNFGTSAQTYTKQVADLNGDGKGDLVAMYTGPSGFWSYSAIGRGDGTFVPATGGQLNAGNFGTGENTYIKQAADLNGDGVVDLVAMYTGPSGFWAYSSMNAAGISDLVTGVTTGLGAVTNITYKPLTDNSVYAKDTGATYPTLDIQAPLYVVSTSSTSSGIGGNYVLSYLYGGMTADLNGRGLLGFRWMETTDTNNPQAKTVTQNIYRQDYPYTGMPILSTKTVNGTLVNRAQNTYTATPLGGTRYAVQLTQSVESSYELNGSLVTTATTNSQYDAYGNPTQIVVSTGDGYTKTTNNTYTNDATNWLLGRLKLATVTSATPSGSLTRTSGFDYHPVNGLLTQEVIEPNTPALRLQTDYSYDGYGNKLTVTVSGSGITTRTTSTVFDAKGQFPTRTTNALGHSDNGTYDARFGKPATLTGPNSLTTTWAYDGFGRKVNETRADGTQTNVAFNPCDSSCPSLAKYYVVTTTGGSPASYAYYDMLNREMRVQVQGFDGRLITKDTFYDSFGRVDRVTKPYYAGGNPLYSRYQYDAIGRVIQETAPDNSTKKMAYNGLITTATNALSQTETKTKNSQGQLVSVRDNLGNLITYQYDPFSNLTKTTDPKGNVTSLTYDPRGRKIGMVDPDMGSWTYTYNVLGELIQQKDAKNQTVNMSYDLLGRMLTRSEPDLNSTWVYDTAVKGIGKLKQVSSDNGFLRVVSYDSLGRTSSETNTIDTTYTVSKSYDAYGRADVLTYPTGVAIKNIYNAYGYLSEVRNNANLALFWKANAKDADGHVLNETLGNGLTTTRTYTDTPTGRVIAIATNGVSAVQNQSFTFDFVGNLKARTDSVTGLNESFGYDPLNRLTSASKGAVTTTVAYDSIGNISNKSDVGTYTYGAKPHAVTQVAGSLNATYGYDANGNLERGAGRTVTYTSYNLPTQITQSANTVNFLYDADHTRIRQTSASGTMIYLNPRIDTGMHFEKEIKNGVTEYKHYLYGAAGVVGVYTTKGTGPDTLRSTQYFHQDHLGSIVAVTNDSAVVIARYAFDPWGKRLTLAGDPQATHHGFTGHEHLDEMGLIHMNGRVYDPAIARFMSADPNIQAPDNLQSYNRYSYVLNNPLCYTDPSGFSWWTNFRDDVLKPVVAIVVSYYTFGALNGLFIYGGSFTASVAAGFVGGAIAGGDLKSAVTGAVTGGLFYGAGSFADAQGWGAGSLGRTGAHAAAGCAGAAAGGGNCGNGALSAGFAEFAGPRIPDIQGIGNVMKYAVLGGTGAALGGGKFENGAMTGAFGYLFNYCAHDGNCTTKLEKALWDYMPGYQVGTCINNGDCTVADWARATGGTAIAIVGGVEVKGAGVAADIAFQTGHYADRLLAQGLNVQAVESAVSNHIAPVVTNLAERANFWGRTTIDGVLVEFRGRLQDGIVRVGTIFPVK